MQVLIPELYESIFEYLTYHEIIHTMQLVHKEFYSLVHRDSLWHRVGQSQPIVISVDDNWWKNKSRFLTYKFCKLFLLDFNGQFDCMQDLLACVADWLECLKISSFSSTLPRLTGITFNRLRSLDILCSCSEILSCQMPALKDLTYRQRSNVLVAQTHLHTIKSLESLTLEFDTEHSHDLVQFKALLPSLHTLKCSASLNLTMAEVKNVTKLRTLHLASESDEVVREILIQNRGLIDLKLSLTCVNLYSFDSFNGSCLEKLELDGVSEKASKHSILATIAERFPRVRELTVNGTIRFDSLSQETPWISLSVAGDIVLPNDSELSDFLPLFPNLRKLKMLVGRGDYCTFCELSEYTSKNLRCVIQDITCQFSTATSVDETFYLFPTTVRRIDVLIWPQTTLYDCLLAAICCHNVRATVFTTIDDTWLQDIRERSLTVVREQFQMNVMNALQNDCRLQVTERDRDTLIAIYSQLFKNDQSLVSLCHFFPALRDLISRCLKPDDLLCENHHVENEAV